MVPLSLPIMLAAYIFDKYLYITDVLYIPDLSFNLIYVPKLTKNLKFQLMFNDNDCMIHDSLQEYD